MNNAYHIQEVDYDLRRRCRGMVMMMMMMMMMLCYINVRSKAGS